MPLIQYLWKQTLRFFYPWTCVSCRTVLPGIDDEGYCPWCWLKIPRIMDPICSRCGIPLPEGGPLCYPCRSLPWPLRVRALATYEGAIRQGILKFKFSGRRSLAQPLASLLMYAWRRHPELSRVDALIPVPSHRSREHERGYNQAALLARALGNHLSMAVWEDVLTRRRPTARQSLLGRQERDSNMRGAIARTGVRQLQGLSLLLIDDVCTTGNTLMECARVLRRAGAVRVDALVLARDLVQLTTPDKSVE
jgi:ComF family protein